MFWKNRMLPTLRPLSQPALCRQNSAGTARGHQKANGMRKRCPWAGTDPLYIQYHDREWGVPLHDDRALFEFLILEGAQAGLSWLTVLKKRAHYRRAFDGFNARKMAAYDERKIAYLLHHAPIIRNRLKIRAAVANARAFIVVSQRFGSFDAYIWRFVDERPIVNYWRRMEQVPAYTPVSRTIALDLKQQGFQFVGPTICYAFMQAVGMVNDHLLDCFRHLEVQSARCTGHPPDPQTYARGDAL